MEQVRAKVERLNELLREEVLPLLTDIQHRNDLDRSLMMLGVLPDCVLMGWIHKLCDGIEQPSTLIDKLLLDYQLPAEAIEPQLRAKLERYGAYFLEVHRANR